MATKDLDKESIFTVGSLFCGSFMSKEYIQSGSVVLLICECIFYINLFCTDVILIYWLNEKIKMEAKSIEILFFY